MAILSNGWYKGSLPFYEITEVSVAAAGSGAESWDGSASQDGSIMCYRIGAKVTVVCSSLTAIGEKAFFKFIALKKVSGLDSVAAIGAYAFCYTPNLASIDLVPGNLTSIGESAFRMSSAEDTLDLSAVSASSIGSMATRHKRWSSDELSAIKSVAFPKTVYLRVPNPENQDNYPDVWFGTYNGEKLSVAEGGCSALTCYHIWNYIHAGTDKQYSSWLDWYNATINKDGHFAENNDMTSQVEQEMATTLGWSDSGNTRVSNAAQLQVILDRLAIGYPTHATIHSVNNDGGTHAVAIVGCNAKTHKLAVIDSHVVGVSGVVAWIAFEDIFIEGDSEPDRIRIMDYNLPVLAPNSTWLTQGGAAVNKAEITEVHIKDAYTPPSNPTASWDASAAKDGSIMAYLEGTVLTLVGNGHGKISLNPDSSKAFDSFSVLARITGGSFLDSSRVTTFERMFQLCFALEHVDVSTWNTSSATSLKAMFQGCSKIGGIDVSKWNTSNVSDLSMFLNMGNTQYTNTNLTELDVSNWDVSNVTNLTQFINICNGLAYLDVSKWDTSACTTMKGAFYLCGGLETLDVSKWDTSACTDMYQTFRQCYALTELDLSNWNTAKVTTFSNMLLNTRNLRKLSLGSGFSWNSTFTVPAPSSSYIDGATGNWYDVNGNAIAPTAVPDKTFGVYYATPAIADEDMGQMVLVKKGSLMKTAAAIRAITGSTKGYAPAEFASAITEGL